MRLTCAAFVLACLCSASALAVPPIATLLPETTRGCLISPDVELMQEKFDQTELGRLLDDPLMKPFLDDVRKQARGEGDPNRIQYGLVWDDVKDLGRGEAAIALVHAPPKRPVRVVLVDVTGNVDAATATLTKIFSSLSKQRIPWKQDRVHGEKLTIYQLPKNAKDPQRPAQAAYFNMQNVLGVVEDEAVARTIMGRIAGQKGSTVESIAGYQAVMRRCQADADAAKAGDPHARLYINPLPYAEARRQIDPQFLKDGKMDLLRAVKNSGFEGIPAVGGYVHFSAKPYDVFYRLAVFAPPPYTKSLKGAVTPNVASLAPPDWIPATVASYTAGSLDLPAMMDNIGPLWDYTIGDGDGAWHDTLEGIREDKTGPQVDLEKRLFEKMGKRITRVTDIVEPIATTSERRLLVADLADAKEALAALEAFYKDDKTAKKQKLGDQEYWEIWPEEAQPGDVPSGLAVARNQMLWASQADMLKTYLKDPPRGKQLSEDADYRIVMEHVQTEAKSRYWEKLCGQRFNRSREVYRPMFELTRQGKLPDSDTLLGSMANMVLGQEIGGKARQQEVDGSKLPPYQKVEHYFLPAGSLGVREDGKEFQGWFFVGFALGKASAGVARRPGE